MKKHRNAFISLLLLLALMLSLVGCMAPSIDGLVIPGPDPEHGEALNLLADVEKFDVTEAAITNEFIKNQMSLSLQLFTQSGKETGNNNLLVSPLSIQIALAMVANGAEGKTLTEVESLLGGEIGIEQLNEYLYTYVNCLPSTEKAKLEIANSIWFKNKDFIANEDFLRINKSYYDSEIYSAYFDQNTVDIINHWVDENTDGMIKEVLKVIPEEAVMYLINAIVFDAEWMSQYAEHNVSSGTFYGSDGTEYDAEMMFSEENTYIELENAIGFKKSYRGDYSFVALLPDENITIDELIVSLDSEKLLNAVSNPSYDKRILEKLPKFEYDYEANLKPILMALGMEQAFDRDKADLSGIGQGYGNLLISQAIHKTFISVAEQGTKAGAVTMIEINDATEELDPREVIEITLNRPFVYMIADNQTNLPIFIGTLTSF